MPKPICFLKNSHIKSWTIARGANLAQLPPKPNQKVFIPDSFFIIWIAQSEKLVYVLLPSVYVIIRVFMLSIGVTQNAIVNPDTIPAKN